MKGILMMDTLNKDSECASRKKQKMGKLPVLSMDLN
jgi:hypothetical protein